MLSGPPRAVGVVRVSQPGDRDEADGRFHSPEDQRERIRALCAEHGFRLVEIYEPELKVSGTAPLDHRPALSRGVTAVLTGNADRIVGGWTERLWRSTEVRSQVLRLVESAGGEVWSGDDGHITNGTAAAKFNGTVRAAADEFYKDQIVEKSKLAVQAAIQAGVPPWPNVTPGYLRGEDGRFVPGPLAPVVLEAFTRRAMPGVTLADVHRFMQANGFPGITLRRVQSLLRSRVVRGEINFGAYSPNLAAHEPIIPERLWRDVQNAAEPRGRRAKSERLLARLGVLRCGTCGGTMVINSLKGQYRCASNNICSHRVTIGADATDKLVTDHVRRALEGMEGRASADRDARDADAALEHAQAELDAAIRAFAALQDEPVALQRLTELREVRDEAREHAGRLRGLRSALVVSASTDWELLTVAERRALIRAVVARVLVAPGRGAGRVTVELVGEEPAGG
jgi:DNA invertase Pin-like site-specific DNA recombinase